MILLVLMGCSKEVVVDEPEVKPNVHLITHQGVDVKIILSKENYNDIQRLEISVLETTMDYEELPLQQQIEKLEENRSSIEGLMSSMEGAQFTYGEWGQELWGTEQFVHVRLSKEVNKRTDKIYDYTVQYVINLDHDSLMQMGSGVEEVIDYFGLEISLEDGVLELDEFLSNEQFIFHEELIAKERIYIEQIEEAYE